MKMSSVNNALLAHHGLLRQNPLGPHTGNHIKYQININHPHTRPKRYVHRITRLQYP